MVRSELDYNVLHRPKLLEKASYNRNETYSKNESAKYAYRGKENKMKNISQLYLGFSDAQNYSQRKNKEAFNEIFVRNHYLDELIKHKETKSSVSYLSATDYEKFFILKKNKNLDLTGYVGMWKVILLLLLAKMVTEKDRVISAFNKSNLSRLNKAIDEYYMNAFVPEITNIMKIMDESEVVARIISKYAEVGANNASKVEFSETRFQHNLYYIEKSFSDAFSKLKLNKDIILFIDGIDIRPDTIPYLDYIECIKGLVDASWTLNTSLFQNVKDSKGVAKVVLLLRPDIYNSLSLQNETNKLLDNSVFLDWRTTYQSYRLSYLYQVAQKLLNYQQNISGQDIFELYFPWKKQSNKIGRESDTAFMEFLRISLSRPRDILVIIQYLQKMMIRENLGDKFSFHQDIFDSDEFQNNYSEYFMSSLKDQLSFYYSNIDFEHFMKFFDFFKDSNFTYDEYMTNYEKFIDYILVNAKEIPEFVDDSQKLLQLLYDSNVIAAVESDQNGSTYFHFSYREKNSANINPKVWKGENVTYRFHYGLYKKAKMGRY